MITDLYTWKRKKVCICNYHGYERVGGKEREIIEDGKSHILLRRNLSQVKEKERNRSKYNI